jgi:hypothetical protein
MAMKKQASVSGKPILNQQPFDEDDVRFVGVRKEVLRLKVAVDDQLDDADTERYRQAARLFAHLLDCDAVDRVMDLPSGQTQAWAEEETFNNLATNERIDRERSCRAPEDLGAALEPRQREAARLLAVEGLTKTAAAAQVGVDRRTITNWHYQPAFLLFLKQLESEERNLRNTDWRARSAAVDMGLQEVREVAIRQAKKMAEEGDPKIIAQVLAKELADTKAGF